MESTASHGSVLRKPSETGSVLLLPKSQRMSYVLISISRLFLRTSSPDSQCQPYCKCIDPLFDDPATDARRHVRRRRSR
jgi:hypothetical protein